MPHDLHFTDYCDLHGLSYFDPNARPRWEAHCAHDPATALSPLPPPSATERAAWRLYRHEQWLAERREMRRRRGLPPVCFTYVWRIVWTGEPLRIVRQLTGANPIGERTSTTHV